MYLEKNRFCQTTKLEHPKLCNASWKCSDLQNCAMHHGNVHTHKIVQCMMAMFRSTYACFY
jgi:hypothetical protein